MFLAPHVSAFGEAIYGARLASSLVDRGWVVDFLAPSELGPVIRRDRRIRFARIDRALTRLDVEVAALARDVLVLVDTTSVDKVVRTAGLSHERLLGAASTVIGIECWGHSTTALRRDYGPWSEVLSPALFDRAHLIRPVPTARPTVAGAYSSIPTLERAPGQRDEVRERWGVDAGDKLIVWPMAGWQDPASQSNRALNALAGLLPHLVLPALDGVGPNVKVVHVSPLAIDPALRPANYRHSGHLATNEFEALLGASDALLSFNASATSLSTALALGIPTCLCTAASYERDPRFRALELPSIIIGWNPPPIWAWPLSLDAVLGEMVRDNPFYTTMARADAFHGEALVATLRALVFDDAERERIRSAQAAYRQVVAALPSGADRVIACVER